ncbi:MAG: GerMN domain-containing protein [Bacilli bacterium]|nr:GerMN domain-containing protein [Bacilli bacterium]
MIRRRAIRKIFITTLSLFIILTVSTITNFKDTLSVNVQLEDVTNLTNGCVYLLNDKGYLVRKNIFIDSNNITDSIRKVINYLKINNDEKYSSNFIGTIPSTCILNDLLYDEGYVTLNFSKSFLDNNNIDICVSSIVYSIYALGDVEGITILVDDSYLDGYPKIIKKDIDINKESFLTSREDITKVVIYYLMNDNFEYYYVPVTKYLNDSRDKINIIVDQLASNTSYDLVSLVNSNIELINSYEENDMMVLNFNNYLFDSDNKVLEEVLYCISYSVFDNYDVDMVMVEVDGKNIYSIDRKSL